jgi:hypothetical protein
MFTKLLPKEASFIRGESPSPDKLNGIMNQLSAATYILESFLGNGLDYRVTSDSERKMLFNVSSAIGKTDKLYKPANKVCNLERIDKRFAGSAASYNSTDKTLSVVSKFVVPAEIIAGDKLGIYYIGQPIVTIAASGYTLAERATYGWSYIPNIPTSIDYFYIENAPAKSLTIKAFYIAERFTDTECYNTGYSVPISNANYYTVKTPCRYSNPAASGALKCATKTCNYCIGNTYNFDQTQTVTYGTPTCSGAVSVLGGGLSYSADTLRPKVLTLQSPINTTENAYAIKYRPFYMHNTALDQMLPANSCMIYDLKDGVNAVKYSQNLYSAGGVNSNIRGDIFYITDNSVIAIGDNKRYLVIGGDYGLVDMVYDLATFIQRQTPVGLQLVGPAVYDDDDI